MKLKTVIKNYNPPSFRKGEILRYAGCPKDDNTFSLLINDCIKEVEKSIIYKVCYCNIPLKISDNLCDFGVFKLKSKDLSTCLKNCDNVILFSATVGLGIDRMITKYSRISPLKALIFQAIGAERIESLCDLFCEDMKNKLGAELTPRFSCGYGDLSLNTQKDIFKILNCEKNIGLYLNDSLLMSPTKSVTAFVGIKNFQE